VLAAGSDGTAACDTFKRRNRLEQVVLLERLVAGDVMLPHVIGDFMPGPGRSLERLRIELADPPRGEHRDLDSMAFVHLQQTPNADPATELPFRELHRRFIRKPPGQHDVEIQGEIHRHPDSGRIHEIRDRTVPRLISEGGCLQLFDFIGERGSCHQFTLDTAERAPRQQWLRPHSRSVS
jgi:hypothetical protein